MEIKFHRGRIMKPNKETKVHTKSALVWIALIGEKWVRDYPACLPFELVIFSATIPLFESSQTQSWILLGSRFVGEGAIDLWAIQWCDDSSVWGGLVRLVFFYQGLTHSYVILHVHMWLAY